MLKAMNPFSWINAHFKALSDKIVTYKALQTKECELDLLSKSIKQLTQDFNTGLEELSDLHAKVTMLEERCSKSLDKADIE